MLKLLLRNTQTSVAGYHAERQPTRMGLAAVSLLVMLFSELKADERAVKGDLFAILPKTTKAAVAVDDVKGFWKQERQYVSKKTLTVFRDTFGITAEALADASAEGMLRAIVSTSPGREADLLLTRVSPQAAKALLQTSQAHLKTQKLVRRQVTVGKHALVIYQRPSSVATKRSIVHVYHAPFLILSSDLQAARIVLNRLDNSTDSDRPPHRIAQALGKLTPSDAPTGREIVWYVDPLAWTPSVPKGNEASSAARRKAKAELATWQRHGLSGVLGIAGKIDSPDGQSQRIEIAISLSPVVSGTLEMFESSSATAKPSLPTWIPRDVESVATLYADVPGVLKGLDVIFDDFFADGIEGTYQQLLDDLRSELKIDLRRDLFPTLGPRITAVTAKQGRRPYQPMLYAFETSSPASAAKSLRQLMQDDPDAKAITIKGFDQPLWHAPPFEKGGEDFIVMVAHGHVFYCNDMALMKQILKTKTNSPVLANDPAIVQQYQQLLIDFQQKGAPQKPCVLFARGTPSKASQTILPTALEMLLDPSTVVSPQTSSGVSVSDLFGGAIPWAEGHRLVAGFRSPGTWRFISARSALPPKKP